MSKPWYRNPVAIMGYGGQVIGLLVFLASYIQEHPIPGLPSWVMPVCGFTLALGSYLGISLHSANVRVAEIMATLPPVSSTQPVAPVPAPPAPQLVASFGTPLYNPGPARPAVPEPIPGAAAPPATTAP